MINPQKLIDPKEYSGPTRIEDPKQMTFDYQNAKGQSVITQILLSEMPSCSVPIALKKKSKSMREKANGVIIVLDASTCRGTEEELERHRWELNNDRDGYEELMDELDKPHIFVYNHKVERPQTTLHEPRDLDVIHVDLIKDTSGFANDPEKGVTKSVLVKILQRVGIEKDIMSITKEKYVRCDAL